tara:strand:- start:681 stop:827 length:147 start_codon:yes stop_codon:yes gene_type:complete
MKREYSQKEILEICKEILKDLDTKGAWMVRVRLTLSIRKLEEELEDCS